MVGTWSKAPAVKMYPYRVLQAFGLQDSSVCYANDFYFTMPSALGSPSSKWLVTWWNRKHPLRWQPLRHDVREMLENGDNLRRRVDR